MLQRRMRRAARGGGPWWLLGCCGLWRGRGGVATGAAAAAAAPSSSAGLGWLRMGVLWSWGLDWVGLRACHSRKFHRRRRGIQLLNVLFHAQCHGQRQVPQTLLGQGIAVEVRVRAVGRPCGHGSGSPSDRHGSWLLGRVLLRALAGWGAAGDQKGRAQGRRLHRAVWWSLQGSALQGPLPGPGPGICGSGFSLGLICFGRSLGHRWSLCGRPRWWGGAGRCWGLAARTVAPRAAAGAGGHVAVLRLRRQEAAWLRWWRLWGRCGSLGCPRHALVRAWRRERVLGEGSGQPHC